MRDFQWCILLRSWSLRNAHSLFSKSSFKARSCPGDRHDLVSALCNLSLQDAVFLPIRRWNGHIEPRCFPCRNARCTLLTVLRRVDRRSEARGSEITVQFPNCNRQAQLGGAAHVRKRFMFKYRDLSEHKGVVTSSDRLYRDE